MTNPGPPSGDDPLAVGEVPPPAIPPAPAYEPSELLAPTSALGDMTAGTPTYDALTRDPDLSGGYEPVSEPGLMTSVRAFAGENPAAFIGGALAVGWLLGKLLSSDDDES